MTARRDFEAKLDRIDAIVKELERPDTKLDRAIALFKEGKTLARECEALLKSAQTADRRSDVGAAVREAEKRAKNDELDDQIPF